MDYINKKLEDMTLSEIEALCNDPKSYNMTWGEYMKIMDAVAKAQNLMNGGTASADNVEINRLRDRVYKLEKRMENLINLLAEFCSDGTEE